MNLPFYIKNNKKLSTLNYIKKNKINKIVRKKIFENLDYSNKNYWGGLGFSKIANKF
jgi:hypothetical protein